jgi:hypothetical protein
MPGVRPHASRMAIRDVPSSPEGDYLGADLLLVPDHQMATTGIADGCVSHSHEAFTSDDLVPQAQFATPEPIQILNQNVQHIVLVLPRFSGGMRRDQHIAQAPER